MLLIPRTNKNKAVVGTFVVLAMFLLFTGLKVSSPNFDDGSDNAKIDDTKQNEPKATDDIGGWVVILLLLPIVALALVAILAMMKDLTFTWED